MQPIGLSVVIPTCGRESLRDTLASVFHQKDRDPVQVLVVQDGPITPEVEGTVAGFRKEGMNVHALTHGPTRDFGNSQRNFAYPLCEHPWIVHMDDDDIFAQDAFWKIRNAIREADSGIELLNFRVVAPWREVVWYNRTSVEQGNLCTIQMVMRKMPHMPHWPKRQGGNIPVFRSYLDSLSIYAPDVPPIKFREEIIAICRPYEEDKWYL